MLKIKEVILVEGLHDKIKLEQVVDTLIIATEGFRIYKDDEKKALIKKLAQERGLIILTDSDSAGFRIRSYIKNILGNTPVKHAYIPQISGKERRKPKPGAEGILGVEGISSDILKEILEKTNCQVLSRSDKKISKTDFFESGLLGQPHSAELRRKLALSLDLPPRLSSNALLEVLNALYTYDEYTSHLCKAVTNNTENSLYSGDKS